jgi:dihydrofolate reductase
MSAPEQKMLISIIVAMDENGGIGVDNRLPWHLPDDLKRFKRLTMGHHLVVGRKTYESIGKPLPGREIIVLTRNPDYEAPGCQIAHSLDEALRMAREHGEEEAFIGGGAQVYAQTLPRADRLYLTRIHATTESDVHFPPIDFQAWIEEKRCYHPVDAVHAYAFTYRRLRRRHL